MTDDADQSSEESDDGRFERFLRRDDGAAEDEETGRDTTDEGSGEKQSQDVDEAGGSEQDGTRRWNSPGSRPDPSGNNRGGEATADGEPSSSREGTGDRGAGDRSRRTWERRDEPVESTMRRPTMGDHTASRASRTPSTMRSAVSSESSGWIGSASTREDSSSVTGNDVPPCSSR